MTLEEIKNKDYEVGLFIETLWYAVFSSENTKKWQIKDVREHLSQIFSKDVINRADKFWKELHNTQEDQNDA